MSRAGRSNGLLAPVDPASMAVLRMAFGLLLALEVLAYFLTGRVDAYFVAPAFHFTYLGFDWVRPWPGFGMHVHFVLLGLAALGLALGLRTRASALLFTLCFGYVFLLEKARYLNHFYLVFLLGVLFCVVPAGCAWSLDARRRGQAHAAPRWALELLRAQIGLVYFFAGVAKLNVDWLRGEPLRTWMGERADMPLVGSLLAHEWAPWVMSYGGLTLDLLAWPLLLCKRTRLATFVVLAGFHCANGVIFSIGIFPWLMVAATTIFFAPDWPRRFAARWRAGAQHLTPAPTPATKATCTLVAFLVVYVGLQLFLPLRHFLYTGSVHWTEEGHRFAWHMKLRTKRGQVRYTLTDPASGEVTVAEHFADLTDWQRRKLPSRPDMIVQYAQHLAAQRFAADGTRVEVRAISSVSLNARPSQPLVDPEVDLTHVRRELAPSSWIVPLHAEPGAGRKLALGE